MSLTVTAKNALARHWDTCLLVLSGTVFLWQATAYFMPAGNALPLMPDVTEAPPVVMVAKNDVQSGALAVLPEAEAKALFQASSKPGRKPKRHPSKKAKPQLKPASIHLNSVTLGQLDLLPGVGPKLARRIIDYRSQHGPFKTIEELKNVKGIGDKNFAKMNVYLAL